MFVSSTARAVSMCDQVSVGFAFLGPARSRYRVAEIDACDRTGTRGWVAACEPGTRFLSMQRSPRRGHAGCPYHHARHRKWWTCRNEKSVFASPRIGTAALMLRRLLHKMRFVLGQTVRTGMPAVPQDV